MICPKCQNLMTIKSEDLSHDSNNNKKYDRKIYWCEDDDIWIRLETPKN